MGFVFFGGGGRHLYFCWITMGEISPQYLLLSDLAETQQIPLEVILGGIK